MAAAAEQRRSNLLLSLGREIGDPSTPRLPGQDELQTKLLLGRTEIDLLAREYGTERTISATHYDGPQGKAHAVLWTGARLCLFQ